MLIRNIALIGLLGFGTAATICTPPAEARTYVAVNLGHAPPPPRYERVVVREGYVWAPGYWRWDGYGYVWVGGYSVRARHGYHYVGPYWAPYGHHHWRYHGGYWRH